MKVRFFLFLLFLFFSVSLYAQHFKGFITLGVNASQIDGDRLSGFYKSGLMGGVGVAWQFHDRWNMSIGTEFMEKGSRTAFRDSVNYFKWKMQYIDFPVAMSLKVHPRFSFQVGITSSVLINDKTDTGFGYRSSDPKNDFVHFLIAPGVEFFPIKNIALLMRYQYSITRFNSRVEDTIPKFHNLISIGLRFYVQGNSE